MYSVHCIVFSVQCSLYKIQGTSKDAVCYSHSCLHLEKNCVSPGVFGRSMVSTFQPIFTLKLHCTALQCTVLQCTALLCTALHCTVKHCKDLHCDALYYTALHCTINDQHGIQNTPNSCVGLIHFPLGEIECLNLHLCPNDI